MVIVQSGKIPDSGGGGKPANLKGICWGNSVLGQDLSEREVPVTTGAVFRARWLPGTWGENMTIMDLDSKSSDTVLERLALDWLDGDHQARLIVDHALTILWSNRAAERSEEHTSELQSLMHIS